MFTKFNPKKYNYFLLIITIVTIIIGSIMINSADSSYTYKQILGAIAGVFILLVVSIINYQLSPTPSLFCECKPSSSLPLCDASNPDIR